VCLRDCLKQQRLRAAIFKSADTAHLILLCYLGDAIRCAVSVDLKMVARNRPSVVNTISIYLSEAIDVKISKINPMNVVSWNKFKDLVHKKIYKNASKDADRF